MKKVFNRLTWAVGLTLLGGTSEAQDCSEMVQVRKVHSRNVEFVCQRPLWCYPESGIPYRCGVECRWTARVTDEPPMPADCREDISQYCFDCELVGRACLEGGQPGDVILLAAEEYPVTTTSNGQGGVQCQGGVTPPDYMAFCDGITPCLCFDCRPTNLSATLLPSGQVGLTWTDTSAGEDGFRIERRSGGGAFAVIATVGADVTSYADSTVGCGLTHTYRVKGFSSFGESDPSDASTVTVGGTIAPTSAFFSADAASGSVAVGGAEGCTWTAVSNDTWIVVAPGTGGSGDGTVQYSVDANPTASLRQGTMTIAGRTFTVTQAGLSCSYSIDPLGASVGSEGGTGSATVVTVPGCAWAARSTVPWIELTSGETGSGPGTVRYSLAANLDTAPRSGELQIAGNTFTVSQAGAPSCTFTLSPPGATFPAAGGTGNVTVTTTPSCAWTATSNDPWITLSGVGSGSNGSGLTAVGSGNVSYAVAPTDSPRTGSLTIAGRVFTVTQEAGCTFTLFPTGASVPSEGGVCAASVYAPDGCPWTAASNVPWITMTSTASGTGNGSYLYVVAANAGPARTGTLTVAGLTFTVSQSAPCSYSLKPTTASLDRTGGSGTFAVTAAPGCPWTAVSSASWVTVQPASGSGTGTVTYSVAANPVKTTRTGTVTVAGQTFTVTQGP